MKILVHFELSDFIELIKEGFCEIVCESCKFNNSADVLIFLVFEVTKMQISQPLPS